MAAVSTSNCYPTLTFTETLCDGVRRVQAFCHAMWSSWSQLKINGGVDDCGESYQGIDCGTGIDKEI